MRYAAILCDEIFKYNPFTRIMITSDYGELLGEDGLFGHTIDHLYTRLILLLRVEGVKISISKEFLANLLKETKIPN